MSTAVAPPMTAEEFFALPDDGTERWLIRGQLRERPSELHDRFHSRTMSRLAHLLGNWLERQPEPRGQVLCGEAGCWLQRDPDSTVGIDVVYIDPEMAGRQTDDTTMLEGVPTLAVEILSPNDTQQEINEKVDTYLSAGVPLVWIVNVHDQTVLVHTPNTEPELFNVTRNVSADPHLPGFEIAVRSIFER